MCLVIFCSSLLLLEDLSTGFSKHMQVRELIWDNPFLDDNRIVRIFFLFYNEDPIKIWLISSSSLR